MKKCVTFLKNPYWSFIGVVFGAFAFFGIRANNFMELNWIVDAWKWSLWIGMFLFSVYNYHFSKATTLAKLDGQKKQIDFVTDLLGDIHTHLWSTKGDVNRCFAYIFSDKNSVSFIWWLRAAECFIKTNDDELIRIALKDALDALKENETIPTSDLNEINSLILEFDPIKFNHEIKALNEEVARLTSA